MWTAVHGSILVESDNLIDAFRAQGWQVIPIVDQSAGNSICELKSDWSSLTLIDADPECWLTGQVDNPNDNMYHIINIVRSRAEDWSFEVMNEAKDVLYRLSDTDFSQTDGIITL